jgi:CRISPR-associated protein Cmr5
VRDLERERAADALAKVKALEKRPSSFKARYRSYVDRLGAAVVMNGLGQALATEMAAAGRDADGEDKAAHRTLAENVCAWLSRPDGVYPGAEDVMHQITSSDQDDYLRAQMETLAWLTWHKKFCRASLPKECDT